MILTAVMMEVVWLRIWCYFVGHGMELMLNLGV